MSFVVFVASDALNHVVWSRSADATCTELQVGGIDVEAKLEEALGLLPLMGRSVAEN